MRQKIPQQPVKIRIKNFLEVALGFSKEEAEKEARRCLQCKEPLCVQGCPVEINIPAFIKLIQEGKRKEALEKIKERNNLPAVCGRVCPQEDQCEAVCVLNKKKIPINIGALERYAADYESEQGTVPVRKTNSLFKGTVPMKIAVVGSGPAGLTCAADLAKMGYRVSLFESLHLAGGVLVYGIPEFRMPKKIVQQEVEYIKSLGVEIATDTLIGASLTIEDLFKDGFKAIFIAVGAGLPQFLGILGENLNRVYSANEFLTRVNLMKAYAFPEYATPINIGKQVAVIGGGNVALDSARVALRIGAKVMLVYRRTEKEMPGRKEEIENAKAEGVILQFLTQPVKILGDEKGFVKGLECIKMELGEADASGRRRPVPIKDSNFVLEADTVIVAIGQNPNPLLPKVTPGLKTNRDATIVVDKNFMTSMSGVFAGGDIITGADTVISAMGAGKKAAIAIDKYIKGE
ncbi:MAG: glutamate synthase (NADPH), homotetrameric [Omnitrophica WOR_2 bacterium RIFCSPLOWO2_01_FULL_41_12]|nr:MAG: glutamate synthase (NADPH), homotetrameric [Omnitrophica WOR_2 bacterium RIFCSPLOWO2_01_FULL_41_12]